MNWTHAEVLSTPACVQFIANWTAQMLESYPFQYVFSSLPTELDTCWSTIHSSMCSIHCQLNWTHAGVLSTSACVQFIANWTGHMLECYPLQHVFSSLPTELDTRWSGIHSSMCSFQCQLKTKCYSGVTIMQCHSWCSLINVQSNEHVVNTSVPQ